MLPPAIADAIFNTAGQPLRDSLVTPDKSSVKLKLALIILAAENSSATGSGSQQLSEFQVKTLNLIQLEILIAIRRKLCRVIIKSVNL